MTSLIASADLSFDLETDCVVIGAGACGLVAALRLSDVGVETLVLERDAYPLGSTSMSSGFVPAAGTRQQQAQLISDSPEQFATDIQHKAGNEADPEIVGAVTSACAEALDWLEQQHDVKWVVLDDFLYPGHSAYRMHSVPGKTGAAMQNTLLSACSRSAIDIVTQARVDALIIDMAESGEAIVRGVRVRRPDGACEHVKASTVILACNGYGANPELMQRFIPDMANAYYHGHAGNTGDAIYWGELLGVPLVHMGAYQGHGSVAAGHHILVTWALMMEGGIQINQSGLRFSNEHGGYSEQAVNVMEQPGGVAWNIYDQRLHELGMTFPDYQQADTVGAIRQAADIKALAEVTGVPETVLENTLADIESLSTGNQSDAFGRQFNAEKTLSPPFYAVKVAPAIFHTQGGLKIDPGARVVNAAGRPVPNLFAAGGAACGVSGSKVAGYLSGNGLLTAVGLGFIAAESVVEALRRSKQ